MNKTPLYMAHSPSNKNLSHDSKYWQTLKKHTEGVVELTVHHLRYVFPRVTGLLTYAKLAAYLHDLGKYRDDFQQQRLQWQPQERCYDPKLSIGKCQHSDAGAKFLDERLRVRPITKIAPFSYEECRELQFVVASHHGALRDIASLESRLGITDIKEVCGLLNKAVADMPEIGQLIKSDIMPLSISGSERAFLIRLLLSALVDADRLDTESHGTPDKTALRQKSQPSIDQLLTYLGQEMNAKSKKDTQNPRPVNQLRREMHKDALKHFAEQQGFFRLTVPTGGGKTLISMSFALKHAQHYDLRRVIYAAPFTTIIDQTAQEFRRIFEKNGELAVLEHHSNLEVGFSDRGQEEKSGLAELATENWDLPIIVTTTVRLLQETLFGNSTSQLRRLHNITGSVIILDEVQNLPAHLLEPTLDALRFLVKYCQCSIVLCTATQPALDESLGFPALDNIRDLIAQPEHYFENLQRVDYRLRLEKSISWPDLAGELAQHKQVLCIVNTRNHARELYQELDHQIDRPEECFHLSTMMCPSHRKKELDAIKRRLADNLPCRVVSTQLIEAGVDIDFPQVYRSMGPLDAIVQAAGRCNREAKLQRGMVTVFLPLDDKLPQGDYRVRRAVSDNILHDFVHTPENLQHPHIFNDYFRQVYDRVQLAPDVQIGSERTSFRRAHAQLYFNAIADAYKIISENTIPVVIHNYNSDKIDQLLYTISNSNYKRERRLAWRALQQYVVNISPQQARQLADVLTDVPQLTERARLLSVEPPQIKMLPISAQYHPKLGMLGELADDVFSGL